MKILQKLVFFCTHANLLFLVLPILVSSTQLEHEKSAGSRTSIKEYTQKLSHKLMFEITIHGLLLWASMGFLMPLGILAIRMSNREERGRRPKILFYIHAISQTISILLATAGAVISFKNFNNSFNNNHQRIGVTLYGLIWLQAMIGFLRPHKGSKARSIWFFVHWILGTGVSLLGIVSIYTGLQAYHEKTSRKISIWTTMFTAEICFITFFYLFQDKWIYIQKQGVILGSELMRSTVSDQVVCPKEKQNEFATEPC